MALPPLELDPNCNSYKTLTLTYASPSIEPQNGYVVKWRIAGSGNEYTVEPNKYGNPIYISNIPSCYNIEGTIQADCGGSLSNPVSFAITSSSAACYSFELLDTATYTYTACGATQSSTVYNNATNSQVVRTVCAQDGTVSGGRFTRGNACLAPQQ